MSNVTLNIEFDNPAQRYLPGDEVSGQVVVEAAEDCRCRGLEVAWGWQIDGKGNQAKSRRSSMTIFEGAWQGGAPNRYPFSFRLPPGPCTYEGVHMGLTWKVWTRARMGLTRDSHDEATFVVDAYQPKEATVYRCGDPTKSHSKTVEERQIDEQLTRLVVGIGGGLFFCSLAVWCVLSFDDLFGLVVGMIIGTGGIGLFVYGFQNDLAQILVGEVDANVSPRRLRVGESLEVSVVIPAKSKLTLNQANVDLSSVEQTKQGYGKQAQHTRAVLVEDKRRFAGSHNRAMEAGETARFSHRLQIPPGAVPSLHAGDNKVVWRVKVAIDIGGWTNWVKTFPIEVWPRLEGQESPDEGSPEPVAADDKYQNEASQEPDLSW